MGRGPNSCWSYLEGFLGLNLNQRLTGLKETCNDQCCFRSAGLEKLLETPSSPEQAMHARSRRHDRLHQTGAVHTRGCGCSQTQI